MPAGSGLAAWADFPRHRDLEMQAGIVRGSWIA